MRLLKNDRLLNGSPKADIGAIATNLHFVRTVDIAGNAGQWPVWVKTV
jgi:hypothetical protein